MATAAVSGRRFSPERVFYLGMALAVALAVYVGFARSFFLRPLFPTWPSPSEPSIYVHGAAFSAWCALLVAQSALVTSGRVGLQFLVVPLFDMLLFGSFVALAVAKRRDAQAHKRWMLLATLNLVTAAVARWPGVITAGSPPLFFLLSDLFLVALVVWDLRSRGRLHPATAWGGALLVLSQPLRLVLSATPLWLAFAGWIVGLPL